MRRDGRDLTCAAACGPTLPGGTATSTAHPASAPRTRSSRSAPTDRKAAVAPQPTLPAARADTPRQRDAGFALIEMLCVLAIIGLLVAIILPSIPRATSRAKLESFAVETAALLKADRTAALRRQLMVTTQVDAGNRAIRSGVTGRVVRFPSDVSLDAYLASRCANRSVGRSIDFFPSGMSCG